LWHDAVVSIELREAAAEDADAIVGLAREIVRDGTTYAFGPDTTDAELRAFWLRPDGATFVACEGADVVGCYLLVPNQRGRGAHVANASYMVAPHAAGRGIGRAMGAHSIREAASRGYRAMQFNYVVSTNEAAIALWTKLGFTIVGRSPRSFDHPRLGFVDTLVMHRALLAALLSVLLLGASDARADIVPAGRKSVRFSMQVDAQVPENKALVLLNTQHLAEVIAPGTMARIGWHPAAGPMQLATIDASAASKIPPLVDGGARDREAVRKATAHATPCGAPFEGVRTVPETSPAREIQQFYRVAFTGDGCTAELVRTRQLDASGHVLDEEPDAAPAPSSSASATPAPPDAPEAPPARRSGSCACSFDEAARGSACCGAVAALAALALRRRSPRR
jgi:L-amino acid N-acyltransferase YncA